MLAPHYESVKNSPTELAGEKTTRGFIATFSFWQDTEKARSQDTKRTRLSKFSLSTSYFRSEN